MMFLSKPQGDAQYMATEPTEEISDAELAYRISEMDLAAFELLYKRYYQRLFRFAYRMTRRLDPIEEIINDVMYVVWTRAATFNPEGRFSTWIFGIAYKKCLKVIAERAEAEHVSLDDVEDIIPGVRDSGLRSMELEDWISVAFSRLPPDQRAVLELAYHHGLHYHEIARIMECPENTVKTRMFHARKKIKSLFPDLTEESGFDFQGKSL